MAEWGRDEHELVRRCREGSDAAYVALVQLHRPRLYALAYRLTGDRATAEDVVQETFLAAFKAIDRFEPKPSLASWLNAILVRIAGRAASKERSRAMASIEASVADGDGSGPLADLLSSADASDDPVAAAEAAELARALAAAIHALPFNQRAAVVLRHVNGMDYAEAARAMGVPLNTFKSHLLRGTRELRSQLGGLLAGPARTGGGSRDGTSEPAGRTGPEIVPPVAVAERAHH